MTPPSIFFRRLRQMVPQLEAEIREKVIALEASKFHGENFRKQGYQDRGLKKWPKRKKQDGSRAVLVKTGRLRRAATHGRKTSSGVEFVLPIYGKVHNEGNRAGRGAGFRMKRRQFAGPSNVLKKRYKDKATALINRRLNRI